MQRLILSLAILATLGFTASTALAQSPDNPSHNQSQLIPTDMGHQGTTGLLHQVSYPDYRPYYHHHRYYRPYDYDDYYHPYYGGYYPYYWGSMRPYDYRGFYRPYPRFHQGFYRWGGHWR